MCYNAFRKDGDAGNYVKIKAFYCYSRFCRYPDGIHLLYRWFACFRYSLLINTDDSMLASDLSVISDCVCSSKHSAAFRSSHSLILCAVISWSLVESFTAKLICCRYAICMAAAICANPRADMVEIPAFRRYHIFSYLWCHGVCCRDIGAPVILSCLLPALGLYIEHTYVRKQSMH